jgi:Gpi18-like mannosyltransferase
VESILKTAKSDLWTGAIGGLFALAVVVRILCLPFSNGDLQDYQAWYHLLDEKGFIQTFASGFANYSPPFMYFLYLATLVKGFIPEVNAIKLIPIGFDLINAWIVFKIVRIKFPRGKTPALASVLFLLLPTVVLNSSFWGQTDALYTCFLLLSLYAVLTERSFIALAAFGFAFSVKAQAVFLLPFLIFWVLKRRIPWYALILIPAAYFGAVLPAVLAGMPVLEILSVYRGQANTFSYPQMNAPNLYLFTPWGFFAQAVTWGLVFSFVFTCVWVFFLLRKKNEFRQPAQLLYLALVSVAFLPFILPKMHDRYFYPADVISLLLAFFDPAFWFLPILYQVISGLPYIIYLFNYREASLLFIAMIFNLATLGFLFWKQAAMIEKFGADSA